MRHAIINQQFHSLIPLLPPSLPPSSLLLSLCLQVTDFFSYEHFYVIYCKFWELDNDHDLEIDAKDLSRHADQGEPTRLAKLSSQLIPQP